MDRSKHHIFAAVLLAAALVLMSAPAIFADTETAKEEPVTTEEPLAESDNTNVAPEEGETKKISEAEEEPVAANGGADKSEAEDEEVSVQGANEAPADENVENAEPVSEEPISEEDDSHAADDQEKPVQAPEGPYDRISAYIQARLDAGDNPIDVSSFKLTEADFLAATAGISFPDCYGWGMDDDGYVVDICLPTYPYPEESEIPEDPAPEEMPRHLISAEKYMLQQFKAGETFFYVNMFKLTEEEVSFLIGRTLPVSVSEIGWYLGDDGYVEAIIVDGAFADDEDGEEPSMSEKQAEKASPQSFEIAAEPAGEPEEAAVSIEPVEKIAFEESELPMANIEDTVPTAGAREAIAFIVSVILLAGPSLAVFLKAIL